MSIMLALLVLSPSVLYDAAADNSPQGAPWFWGLTGTGGTQSPPNGSLKTTLDTTANIAFQKGWINVVQSGLDPAKRPRLTFDLRVVSETHVSADRAGLSVIVLANDLKGVELSFWEGQVWAQNDLPLFTHGESALCDTTSNGTGRGGLRRYGLMFDKNNYWLSVDGVALLHGPRRDYSAFTGNPNPYVIPNVLWVGDDTQSASSKFEFSYFETGPTLPRAHAAGG